MRAVMLLLVLYGVDGDLEHTTTISIRGFGDVAQCEQHLAILKRSIPPNLTIKKSDCYEGIV